MEESREANDIERHLDRLTSTVFLSTIVQSVIHPLRDAQPALDWRCSVSPDALTFRVGVADVTFDFVFWLGNLERFSFFIADREIIDEFLESREQAEALAACLHEILSSPVTIVEHTRDSDGLAVKREYHYTLSRPDGAERVAEAVTLSGSKLETGERIRRASTTVTLMRPVAD